MATWTLGQSYHHPSEHDYPLRFRIHADERCFRSLIKTKRITLKVVNIIISHFLRGHESQLVSGFFWSIPCQINNSAIFRPWKLTAPLEVRIVGLLWVRASLCGFWSAHMRNWLQVNDTWARIHGVPWSPMTFMLKRIKKVVLIQLSMRMFICRLLKVIVKVRRNDKSEDLLCLCPSCTRVARQEENKRTGSVGADYRKLN